MSDSHPSESLASEISVRALHADLLDVSCALTNSRLALEQALFALQDKNSELQDSVEQLQVNLAHVSQLSLESRHQVAVARLEIQQLHIRVEEAEARVRHCEQALDL